MANRLIAVIFVLACAGCGGCMSDPPIVTYAVDLKPGARRCVKASGYTVNSGPNCYTFHIMRGMAYQAVGSFCDVIAIQSVEKCDEK